MTNQWVPSLASGKNQDSPVGCVTRRGHNPCMGPGGGVSDFLSEGQKGQGRDKIIQSVAGVSSLQPIGRVHPRTAAMQPGTFVDDNIILPHQKIVMAHVFNSSTGGGG